MAEVKTDSVGNPAIAGAKAAAREFIAGFETGTSTFNEIGGNNLRNGDAAVINQIRQNRRDAKKAYEKLDEL